MVWAQLSPHLLLWQPTWGALQQQGHFGVHDLDRAALGEDTAACHPESATAALGPSSRPPLPQTPLGYPQPFCTP